jgi:hypothetical protein
MTEMANRYNGEMAILGQGPNMKVTSLGDPTLGLRRLRIDAGHRAIELTDEEVQVLHEALHARDEFLARSLDEVYGFDH